MSFAGYRSESAAAQRDSLAGAELSVPEPPKGTAVTAGIIMLIFGLFSTVLLVGIGVLT